MTSQERHPNTGRGNYLFGESWFSRSRLSQEEKVEHGEAKNDFNDQMSRVLQEEAHQASVRRRIRRKQKRQHFHSPLFSFTMYPKDKLVV